ncbi:amidohydrolase [Saccharopolyspora karakumensis]|uniref:Amidohydrolase n=1 Tax=Saccharopolyspora karakumensis TaxID=2530386 RepID=A0A4R5BQG7_9PSEU|nr:amidohydrolase family protein [Saccharopolyspora karakumensis]TDD87746.1 amidohydrolase [Saccharopolyspora karakumensis]
MATALLNGRIHTVDPVVPWVQAALIEDGAFTIVGSDDEVRSAAPDDTEFIDLHGHLAMPGLHDAHTHLLFSGLKFRHEARLTPSGTPGEIVRDLQECQCGELVDEGELAWIVGGEFVPSAFEEGELDRSFLDRAVPDQPVFLYDYTIHHGLANTKALEIAGLSDDTPDPPGGRLMRRPGTNQLTGELVEQARWPVMRAIPDYRSEIYRDAVGWAASTCHRYGITSVQEASASPQALAAFRDLDDADDLNLHVAAHLVWREEGFGMATTAELERTIAEHASHASTHVDTKRIKIWLDGAPLPPHMTHADLDEHGNIDPRNILVAPDQLAQALCRFDEAGLSVKIHCAGKGSVRAALDAFDSVRRINGNRTTTHEIAHCTFIPDQDYERFKHLNVVAEMSPAIWHIPEYGLDDGFKFRTVLDSGATMTIGSDWIITPNPNLFPALQGMLQRGPESIDLTTAVQLLTLGGAQVVGRAQLRGSISPGKSADLIVLDRNIFEIPTDQIGTTRVLRTVFEGRTVFLAEDDGS